MLRRRARFIADLSLYFWPTHPSHLSWAITSRCNSNCLYCEASQLEPRNDLSFSRAMELIDEIYSFGVRNVHLTGGEPFLNKNIWNMLEKLNRYRIGVSIPTNGSIIRHLEERELNTLRRAVERIDISLDSLDETTHDYLRGREGAYVEAVSALDILREARIRSLAIKMAVCNVNYREIPEMLHFAKSRGADHVNFQLVGQTSIFSDAETRDKKHFLLRGEEDLQNLLRVIDVGMEMSTPLVNIFIPPLMFLWKTTAKIYVLLKFGR